MNQPTLAISKLAERMKPKKEGERANSHYLMQQKKILRFTSLLWICEHSTMDTLPFVKMKECKTHLRECI